MCFFLDYVFDFFEWFLKQDLEEGCLKVNLAAISSMSFTLSMDGSKGRSNKMTCTSNHALRIGGKRSFYCVFF